MVTLNDINLLILDKDGTIVQPVEKQKGLRPPNAPHEQKLYPDVLAKLEPYHKAGIPVALCSNQGGVGFGIMTELDAHLIMQHAATLIEADYYTVCFTHPKARNVSYRVDNDPRRKPNAGMLLEAMAFFNTDKTKTVYVGDSLEDEQAADNAGVIFLYAHEFFHRSGGKIQW